MLSEFLLRLTGMPSPGKTRLAAALEAAGLQVSSSRSLALSERQRVEGLRVHAETDLEALLEPDLLKRTRADAAAADLIVAVDWESTAHSVGRVIALAESRGVAAGTHEAA